MDRGRLAIPVGNKIISKKLREAEQARLTKAIETMKPSIKNGQPAVNNLVVNRQLNIPI